MKQLLGTLWTQFVAAGAPARWAVAAVVTCALAIGGFSLYQARNPHFEVLVSDLDSATFSRAVAALANGGFRYRTTMPPGPFTIFVESPRKFEALNAIHLAGDFTGPSRGIDADITGSSAMFLGQRERDQRSEKRDWQETELQLEELLWVSRAFVKVSGSSGSTLLGARRDARWLARGIHLRSGWSLRAGLHGWHRAQCRQHRHHLVARCAPQEQGKRGLLTAGHLGPHLHLPQGTAQ